LSRSRRDVGFEWARAHPTRGPHEVFFDDLGAFLDSFRADAAVQKNRRGQFQLVQNFEQALIPDLVAVVAPGEIARRPLAAQNLLFLERCGSHVERSRGECIKQEITARSPKMGCSSMA
jgi:hypothetical protein